MEVIHLLQSLTFKRNQGFQLRELLPRLLRARTIYPPRRKRVGTGRGVEPAWSMGCLGERSPSAFYSPRAWRSQGLVAA